MESGNNKKSCCTPATGRKALKSTSPSGSHNTKTQSNQRIEDEAKEADLTIRLQGIPAGDSLHGTNQPMIPVDEEGPCRSKRLDAFNIMETTVTNEMFASFIAATDYITEAQRYGWSFVFHSQLPDGAPDTQAVPEAPWWRKVDGACWNLVNGPGSESDWHPDHPVVHVSWNDANAFAKWAGGRLPSESEWEHAARGGLGDVAFPWGNREPDDTDYQPCNIWQGSFPDSNSLKDGYVTTAPAKSYQPNGFGLYNMCGNVWEWTSGRFKLESRSAEARSYAKRMRGSKLLKGGSFLCHKSYCFRYRIAARTGTTPDSTTSHQGFRLVF